MKEVKVKKIEKEEPIIEEVKEPKVKKEAKREAIFYIVRQGETLEDIANKFNTNVETLRKINGNINPVGGNQIVVM